VIRGISPLTEKESRGNSRAAAHDCRDGRAEHPKLRRIQPTKCVFRLRSPPELPIQRCPERIRPWRAASCQTRWIYASPCLSFVLNSRGSCSGCRERGIPHSQQVGSLAEPSLGPEVVRPTPPSGRSNFDAGAARWWKGHL
jgi:hypothetical protein